MLLEASQEDPFASFDRSANTSRTSNQRWEDMYSGGKQFPLHEAAFKDSEDAVKRVLKSGTLINCRDDLGMTALMVASLYSERVSTIEMLLKHGAEIDAMDNFKQTALWHCISNDQNEIVAKLLIVKGITTIDPSLFLHPTILPNPFFTTKGAHINLRAEDGTSALMRACYLGKVELVRFLLKYGASCSPRERKSGKTALALALTGTIIAINPG